MVTDIILRMWLTAVAEYRSSRGDHRFLFLCFLPRPSSPVIVCCCCCCCSAAVAGSPVTVTLGTVSGRRSDLTIGLARVCTGSAGLLAHRAAPVSCDTSEYWPAVATAAAAAVPASGLDDVRNARFSFDLMDRRCVRWSAAAGAGCIRRPLTSRCGPSSGSLPHRPYDVVRSSSRFRASFSMASAQLYRPQNRAHCSARRPRPVSRMVGDAPAKTRTDTVTRRL